jgi:photosystem II stability/assembly factor-like uncharacterized protein
LETVIYYYLFVGVSMKRIILTIAFLFIASAQVCPQPVSPLTSQGGWFWQNPSPQGNTIFAIEFVSEKVGWMSGDYGRILKTIDGGITWNFQNSGTEMAITDISFINENQGWACGHSGVIIHTEDGGENWNTQDSGRVGWLSSITFVDEYEGWAVGYYNELFHTTNGGLNWDIEYLSLFSNRLGSIFFLNSSYGWITGINEIFKTTNGGIDWVSILGPSFRKLFFTSENVGWGIGDLGKISKTTNGGMTWQEQLNTGLDNFESVKFLNEFKGYITAWFGRIFYTEDGGEIWKMIQMNMDNDLTLRDIAFVNATNYLLVGDAGIMIKSFDGGNSWDRMDKYGFYHFRDIQFLNDSVGWLVGSFNSAIAFKTIDGGKTWNEKLVIDDASVEAVSFIDEQCGWIAGTWSKIYHTSDAGTTWDTLNTPVPGMFNGIQFFEPGIGYLCAPGYPKIFKTKDKGYNWIELTVPVLNDFIFNSFFFTDEINGWIIAKEWLGRNHKLLHTKDGGETWEINYEVNAEYLWDIFFIDNRNGWVVGDSGIVLKTQDGGINWQIIQTESKRSILCTYFKNESEGYIGGIFGYIASTNDGGYTWKPFQTWCNNHIEKVYVFDDHSGIAIGGGGTILRNNNLVVVIDNSTSFNHLNNFSVSQNYPNPFNPSTKISWQSPVSSWQTLKVYDILGNEVATLVNEYKDAGYHEIEFNAAGLSSGVYFYRIQVGEFIETKKMIF